MKYPKIAATLGWTETPDSQDGLFLQPEEAAKLDKTIADAETSTQQAATEHSNKIAAAVANLATANIALATEKATVTRLSGEVVSANDQLATATSALTVAQARVTELENLSGRASGTITDEDPKHSADTKEMKKYHCSYDELFA